MLHYTIFEEFMIEQITQMTTSPPSSKQVKSYDFISHKASDVKPFLKVKITGCLLDDPAGESVYEMAYLRVCDSL